MELGLVEKNHGETATMRARPFEPQHAFFFTVLLYHNTEHTTGYVHPVGRTSVGRTSTRKRLGTTHPHPYPRGGCPFFRAPTRLLLYTLLPFGTLIPDADDVIPPGPESSELNLENGVSRP